MKYLTICMNFRDESEYLKEWLDYHILVGVDHFILYNNFSSDNYLKVLNPYIAKNKVTLLNTQHKRVKHYTYPNTIKEYKNFSRWIAFIDCDEFLVPEASSLKVELEKFEKYPGIHICSKFFGNNGHIKKPSGGVIRNFLKRRNDSNSGRILVKSIVNPALTVPVCRSPHWFQYKNNLNPVDTSKNKIYETYRNSKAVMRKPNYSLISLNHYWCKSYEEYMVKHNKPNDSTGDAKRKGHAKKIFDDYNKFANKIEDLEILKIWNKR